MRATEQTPLHAVVRDSPSLAPSTRAIYLRDLNKWVAFAGESPAGWTRHRATDFYRHLLATMKPQSANRVMASLRYAARWWATLEAQPSLDFGEVQLAANGEKAKRSALSPEEAVLLLDTCRRATPRDVRDLAILVTLLETGMRRMSLTSMDLEQLDARGGRGGYPVAHVLLKGRAERRHPTPLSETVVAALDPWLLALAGARRRRGPVFCSITPGPAGPVLGEEALCEQAVYKIVTERAAEAGLRHVHPHVLRHSCITWRIGAGVAPHLVAALTGHRLSGAAAGNAGSRGDGMGAMHGYVDQTNPVIVAQVRDTTPRWLAEAVLALTSR